MRLPPLIKGRLLRRYKRFMADIEFASGEVITAHCANPGAMLGLHAPGSTVWVSHSTDPSRKLKYSWHLIEADFGVGASQIVGVDTSLPNRLAEEAFAAGILAELAGYDSLRREVRYGTNSRIDLLLSGEGRPDAYVEIKNVHFMREPGLAEFPDSVTSRGAKHLEEMGAMVEAGHRAVMLYVIQMRAERFTLATDLDPAYARAFARAHARGVEAYAYCCDVSPEAITLDRPVTLLLP